MLTDESNDLLHSARDAFRRHDWVTAHAQFVAAREQLPLQADDLYALADSAWWLGLIDESLAAFEQAYRMYVDDGQPRPASMAALTIGYTLSLRGEMAIASGWLSRSVRLLRNESEGVEHGFLLYIDIDEALEQGDVSSVIPKARTLQEMGRRFADSNLSALGVLSEGLALIRQGQAEHGMDLLDEAMLAALSDDLDPAWAGNVYCNLMVACYELGDFRRAVEWTHATTRWCESLPAAGPFLGICRVHRAQIYQLQGDWEQSELDATQVYADMARFDVATVAEAYYQVGEVRRLRGDVSGAAEAYRQAHTLGRDPQPGSALLQAAEGHHSAAAASIQAALMAGTGDKLGRVRLLAAQVEIALALGDAEGAMAAGEELHETASIYQSAGLVATALHARGAILLAQGKFTEAFAVLRAACRKWQELSAPYETARARVLLATVYEALDDTDAANRELDAASSAFERLGAIPDATAVHQRRLGASLPGGLTEREIQVITMVADGKTNRQIGEELFISPKTVARHLENIFTKLAISSRASAAAWAIKHGLVPRATNG